MLLWPPDVLVLDTDDAVPSASQKMLLRPPDVLVLAAISDTRPLTCDRALAV